MTEAEEKIVQAAVDCIEEYGIQNTTIRRISEKANMNSASISYYFRSKDVLIERILSATLDSGFGWDDFIYTEPMPLNQQLFEIFNFFATNAEKFPNLIRAHFYEIVNHGNYDTPITTTLKGFLEKLFNEVKRKKPDMQDNEIRLALTQITAACMLYYTVFPHLFDSFTNADMTEVKMREEYLKRVINRLI